MCDIYPVDLLVLIPLTHVISNCLPTVITHYLISKFYANYLPCLTPSQLYLNFINYQINRSLYQLLTNSSLNHKAFFLLPMSKITLLFNTGHQGGNYRFFTRGGLSLCLCVCLLAG